MTKNATYDNMEPFENPDCLPLQTLKLKIQTDGVVRSVEALGTEWVSKRYFLFYEAPNIYDNNGCEIQGAKAQWIETVNYIIGDLKWLLSLPFYRFWSNIIYNSSILDTIVSFLQEAPPFYALESFPNCTEMHTCLEKLREYVLVVFTRLITNKESQKEYMSHEYFGNLLYENYIFSIPIIFDLCQLYGRENEKVMTRILDSLFKFEPRYNNDLQRTVPHLIEALENVKVKFVMHNTYTIEAASLSEQQSCSTNLTLFNIEDMILYILDIMSTVKVFIYCYHQAASTFHTEDFINEIISMYENTIPKMYKKLHELAYNDRNMAKYKQLKHYLDVTRIEVINLFRTICEPLTYFSNSLNTNMDVDTNKHLDKFFDILNHVISETAFVTDYNQYYPIKTDLDFLSDNFPNMDMIKYNYILKSIDAVIGNCCSSSSSCYTNTHEVVAGPSGISSQAIATKSKNGINATIGEPRSSSADFYDKEVIARPNDISNEMSPKVKNFSNDEKNILQDSVKMTCLVSSVKDVLCNLDEQFIVKCLQHYHFDPEAVINAVLEGSLPHELEKVKDIEPSQEPIAKSLSYYESVNKDRQDKCEEALNVPHDEDCLIPKTSEVIEVAKDYIIKNYSNIDVYDDEYDDTYDTCGLSSTIDDNAADADSRAFTTPRVLCERQRLETADESDTTESEGEEVEPNTKDHFIQNPEEVRAKAAQLKQAMRGRNSFPSINGNPKRKQKNAWKKRK